MNKELLKLQKSPNSKDTRAVKNLSSHGLDKPQLGEAKNVSSENKKPPGKGELQKGRQANQQHAVNPQLKNLEREIINKSPDSIPDDASFVAKINARIQNDEIEKEDLDEFELLENCADNMSFCSQSSFVTRIFQKDRLKHETLKPVPQVHVIIIVIYQSKL